VTHYNVNGKGPQKWPTAMTMAMVMVRVTVVASSGTGDGNSEGQWSTVIARQCPTIRAHDNGDGNGMANGFGSGQVADCAATVAPGRLVIPGSHVSQRSVVDRSMKNNDDWVACLRRARGHTRRRHARLARLTGEVSTEARIR
jgi:hypothetical protein